MGDNSRGAGAGGATFTVADMSCAHCVGAIHDALTEGMPGAAVSVDLDGKRVVVDRDPDTAAALIREAGYDPVLVIA